METKLNTLSEVGLFITGMIVGITYFCIIQGIV